MSDHAKKCAHPSCGCLTEDKYCSTFCSGQAETPDIQCSCGHEGCLEEEEPVVS